MGARAEGGTLLGDGVPFAAVCAGSVRRSRVIASRNAALLARMPGPAVAAGGSGRHSRRVGFAARLARKPAPVAWTGVSGRDVIVSIAEGDTHVQSAPPETGPTGSGRWDTSRLARPGESVPAIAIGARRWYLLGCVARLGDAALLSGVPVKVRGAGGSRR